MSSEPQFIQLQPNEQAPDNYSFWRIDAQGNRWVRRDTPSILRAVPEHDEPTAAESPPAKKSFLKRILGVTDI